MSTLVLASAEYDLIGRFPIGKNPLKQKTHDSKTGATYRLHWCSKKVQVVFFCPTSLGYAEDLLQMANVLYRRDGGRCFFFLHLKAPPTILHPSGWMQRFQRHRKDMIPSDDHEDWVIGIGAAECQYWAKYVLGSCILRLCAFVPLRTSNPPEA